MQLSIVYSTWNCTWTYCTQFLHYATLPMIFIFLQNYWVKSYGLSCEDALDKDDWRLRMKAATGGPKFARMAIKHSVSVCALWGMTELNLSVVVGIWLLQSSGSIFCLLTSAGANSCNRLQEVAGPATVDDVRTVNSLTFSTFSATPYALCGLMADGRLFMRTGMGPHCPTGVNWSAVALPDVGLLCCFVFSFLFISV